MHQHTALLPPLVNEIKAGLEVIQQVLLLGVPERHGHPRHPQPLPGLLHDPHQPPGGHRRGRRAVLPGDHAADLLGGDGEARAAVGDEGDGGGADDGEDVGDVGAVREGPGEGRERKKPRLEIVSLPNNPVQLFARCLCL